MNKNIGVQEKPGTEVVDDYIRMMKVIAAFDNISFSDVTYWNYPKVVARFREIEKGVGPL